MRIWTLLVFPIVITYAFLRQSSLKSKWLTLSNVKCSPKALVVTVEIRDGRIEEFLKVIKEDAVGSRERENGGCLRFDVLRDASAPNKFIFYEVYKDTAAIDFHKATPHFALWSKFKESGGVISQHVSKADAIFFET